MKHLLSFVVLFLCINMNAQLQQVAYTDGNQKLNGLGAKSSEENPSDNGILILPAWKGIDLHSKATAETLSRLGYHVFIADIYGEGNYPPDSKAAGEIAGYYKKNRKDYQRRIKLALDQLVKLGADPDQIVTMGYCFGGTGALEAARSGMKVKGVVSIHGGLAKDPSSVTTPIAAKVLVCHGADDPFEPTAVVDGFQQEMREAKADWQMIYYANAVHAFSDPSAGNDNSKGAAYNEKAAIRSWEHLLVFLREVLQ